MRIPITVKNIKSQLFLLTIILFVGVGLFWQAEIREMLFSGKGLFTGVITSQDEQELTRPLSITLPKEETAVEIVPEKEIPVAAEPKEETGVLKEQPLISEEKPVFISELSKQEILKQIEEISARIALLTEKAENLAKSEQEKKVAGESTSVSSFAEQEKQARFQEIQVKINDISQQIEAISQTINKLAQEKQTGAGNIQI